MCDALNMTLHVADLYAMGDWVLTVCIANFVPFSLEFLGIIMKGSGVAVVARPAKLPSTAFLRYVSPLEASPAECS